MNPDSPDELVAMTDPLTGIGNRRAFFTVLQKAIRQAVTHSSPLSVLSLDLDHFKKINNDFGHMAGDRVLQGVTVRLQDALGGDGFLARTGGDRFGAVLFSTDPAAAVEVAERLRRAVEDWRFAPQDWLPPDRAITVSIGVATLVPSGMADQDILVGAADDALHRANADGRNRVSVWLWDTA